ncbi:MAG: LysR family transcriptional regulator [Clostridiales bacterium]|nr:LysR family transcriptional regulator [Clostridiales bacterium]
MNIKHAHYILSILREGSYTNAAKTLYVSQPSLSQTVKQVEKQYGVQIFDRTYDTPTLTFAGRKYVDAAKQVLLIDANLQNEFAELKKEVRARMRLGIPHQRGMLLLPRVVPEFLRQYPCIKIDLEEHGSETLERLAREGMVDIALVTTHPKQNQLEYILIENEQLVLMVSKKLALAEKYPDGSEIDIHDAAQERFISMRPGHSVRVIQDRLFEKYNLEPNILIETNSLEAAKNITAPAGAVMICPYVYIAKEPKLLEQVHCYPIRNNDYERHFYLCYRKGLYFAKYMQDFLEIVRQNL